jgi:hypothetical protein
MGNIGSLARMLDGYRANVSLGIKVDERIFVEIPRLSDRRCPEFDVKRVRILEVFDSHGSKPRSKEHVRG